MYLGIDVGGTKTLFAVFDEHGKILLEHKVATDKTYSRFLEDIKSLASGELSAYRFQACCCAVPGTIDRDKQIVKKYGNLSWTDTPVRADLEKLFPHCPVLIENDAKLAGLSEALLVQEKYKRVLYVTLSTGIGISFIKNGVIDTNAGDAGGKALLLEHDGKLVSWESFGSGKSLVERYGKKASEIDDPAIWRQYAIDVAQGLDQYVATFQPEVIIIGGGVGAHFDKFGTLLNEELAKYKTSLVDMPPVVQASKPEEAVIYGCYDYIKQSF